MHDVTHEMFVKVAGWYPIIEMLLQSSALQVLYHIVLLL